MKNIAIFASGSGTNAENIVKYFEDKEDLNIKCICSNNKEAYVLQRADRLGIPSLVFGRQQFYESDFVDEFLEEHDVEVIVLAGFLWLFPERLVERYTIINIHPALLPKFGGKGMYGDRVHRAVVEQGETESGITIHLVNKNYDEGHVLFQAKCPVMPTDTADDVAHKVHQLEYEHFPRVIAEVLRSTL